MFPLASLMIAALLFSAGCGVKTADPVAEKAEGVAPSQSVASPGESSKVIAVVPKSTNLVFWQSVHAGAQEAGKAFGYEIVWDGPDREANSARQIQIVDEAVENGVAGVVLAPVDRFELAPSVEKLADSKIPCTIIDSGVQSVHFVCFASTDNYAGGIIAAQRMGKLLGGQGNVLVLQHLPGSQSTRRRVNGFTETLTNEFPAIRIVDSQFGKDTVETAMQTTEGMLKQHQDVQGLFACNITTSVGALQALQTQKRTGVKMVAFDPDPALLDGMRAGQIEAIILQDPYQMGYEGVKALAAHIKGESVPRIVDTGIEVATTESLTDPKIKRLLSSE